MEVEKRGLYNSLRLHWKLDSNLDVEPWQVEDYRKLPLDELFKRLEDVGIKLDRTSFHAYAAECDSPEELYDTLVVNHEEDTLLQDKIFLVLFELFRRLESEKKSLSIFCDELDYQIEAYDEGKLNNVESLEDAIETLEQILDENIDSGVDPKEVFQFVSNCCANDIENFMYDYTSEQIDAENFSYAQDLLDDFEKFVKDPKWFLLLRARLYSDTDHEDAKTLEAQVEKTALASDNLQYHLDVLSYLSQAGNEKIFHKISAHTVPLLNYEEDLQDFLGSSIDFLHFQDKDELERKIAEILISREKIPEDRPVNQKDPDILEVLKILKKS
jgi:hypothetical protein